MSYCVSSGLNPPRNRCVASAVSCHPLPVCFVLNHIALCGNTVTPRFRRTLVRLKLVVGQLVPRLEVEFRTLVGLKPLEGSAPAISSLFQPNPCRVEARFHPLPVVAPADKCQLPPLMQPLGQQHVRVWSGFSPSQRLRSPVSRQQGAAVSYCQLGDFPCSC